jgi:hypothetical protein
VDRLLFSGKEKGSGVFSIPDRCQEPFRGAWRSGSFLTPSHDKGPGQLSAGNFPLRWFKINALANPRTVAIMMRLWTLACFSVLVIGCTSLTAQYLDEVTGKATQDEVRQKLRPPMEERTLSTGESVWQYRETGFSAAKSSNYCQGYNLTFDSQKVLKQWNRLYC